MSRAAVPLALLAGLLLGGALLRAEAQPPPPPATVWEYKVLRVDPADYNGKEDYEQIKAQHGGDATRADAPFQQHVLTWMGKEGWELVAIERLRPNLPQYVFKRPARS